MYSMVAVVEYSVHGFALGYEQRNCFLEISFVLFFRFFSFFFFTLFFFKLNFHNPNGRREKVKR